MRIHIVIASALALLSLPGMARAQTCTLKQVASIDMFLMHSSQPMVPVTINGTPKLFLLDTGGYTTQVSRDTVDDLALKEIPTATQLYDVGGNVSRSFVAPDIMTFGSLKAEHLRLMVSPANLNADGILSADLMFRYDIEMDFGAGKLNYFSQDHCPGKVVYWNPQSVAVVPLAVRDRHITIQVTLDGKPFDALVDTGATRSIISMPVAQAVFGLGPDSPGVTPSGYMNGEARLASYMHTFSSLAFEGIAVSNPSLVLMPDRLTNNARGTGSRLAMESAIKLPQLILGMDILRHLRMYMALKENAFYVSAATPAPEAPQDPGQSRQLSDLDKALSYSPASATLLNERCFERAVEKVKLEGALADCDLSLRAHPDSANVTDSRGFVLYQMGRYQDAVAAYDQALKQRPDLASALYARGHARKKLGDIAGGDADIAAARKLNPYVEKIFGSADIAAN